jgi:hypothetical protein
LNNNAGIERTKKFHYQNGWRIVAQGTRKLTVLYLLLKRSKSAYNFVFQNVVATSSKIFQKLPC